MKNVKVGVKSVFFAQKDFGKKSRGASHRSPSLARIPWLALIGGDRRRRLWSGLVGPRILELLRAYSDAVRPMCLMNAQVKLVNVLGLEPKAHIRRDSKAGIVTISSLQFRFGRIQVHDFSFIYKMPSSAVVDSSVDFSR